VPSFLSSRAHGLYNYMVQHRGSLMRYVMVSVLGYGFAAGGLYLLNRYQWIDPRLGYALVYLVIYAVQYPITIYFIYRVKHKTSNLLKYGVYLFLNWSVASALYFVLSHWGLGIFQAFVLVALIMFPLRFVFGKRVYR
jgi:putative flippase GtrA